MKTWKIALTAAVLGSQVFALQPVIADTAANSCADMWQKATKVAGKANGQTQAQFTAKCLADQKAQAAKPMTMPAATMPATPVVTAPAVTAPAKPVVTTPAVTAPAKPAVAAPAMPAPAATPAPAVAAPAATVPTAVKPAVVAAPAAATATATAGASNGFATEQLAKAHCPKDNVVWDNTSSHIYHYAGTHFYGTSKDSIYRCEADAKAAGDRAALNEHPPKQ